MRNQPSGLTHQQLLDRAAAAIIRQYTAWGVSEAEARAAVERNFVRRQRLGSDLAAVWTWHDDQPIPKQRHPDVIHVREPTGAVRSDR